MSKNIKKKHVLIIIEETNICFASFFFFNSTVGNNTWYCSYPFFFCLIHIGPRVQDINNFAKSSLSGRLVLLQVLVQCTYCPSKALDYCT